MVAGVRPVATSVVVVVLVLVGPVVRHRVVVLGHLLGNLLAHLATSCVSLTIPPGGIVVYPPGVWARRRVAGMRFTVPLPMLPAHHYVPMARAAEANGFDSVAVPDSVFFAETVTR